MGKTNGNNPQGHKMLKRWILAAFVTCLIIFLSVDRAVIGSPTTPKSRLDDPLYAMRYKNIDNLVRENRSSARLLFVGDSVFQGFEDPKPLGKFSDLDVWQHYYCDRNALELGFYGDTTSNVLWRIQNGEMDGLSPSAVVLLVSVNNLAIRRWFWSPASDVQGVDEMVSELHSHLPGAHIILLGVLPFRGHESGWIRQVDYLWKVRKVKKINGSLADQFGRGTVPYVTYVDLTDLFMKGEQTNASLFADRVHPTPEGHALIASTLEPYISRIMGDTPKGSTVIHSPDCAGSSPCACAGILKAE